MNREKFDACFAALVQTPAGNGRNKSLYTTASTKPAKKSSIAIPLRKSTLLLGLESGLHVRNAFVNAVLFMRTQEFTARVLDRRTKMRHSGTGSPTDDLP